MQVTFATNNSATALEYMQQVEPTKKHTAESAKALLALVDEGILRVGDPFIHKGTAPILPGDLYTDDMKGKVMSAIKELRPHNRIP